MKIQTYVLAMALEMAFILGAAPGASRSTTTKGMRPTITLRVVNEGGVDSQSLVQARKEATRIFDHSGINLAWLDCESGQAEWGNGSPCQRSLGPVEFWMRIVTRRPPATTGDMLGFTHLDERWTHGAAGVYYPAAVEMAKKWPATIGEILAAAIAHEVGHLILGANAHSANGVMSAHWSKPEFIRIGTSALHFTRDQGRLLQEGIARRAAGRVVAAP
ncbi:MAG TPA: hypothetical protein VME43_11740 [Bryobacteraceae bacterium]|nr:hypothetical protein [Bryobacteraceae bacterium]